MWDVKEEGRHRIGKGERGCKQKVVLCRQCWQGLENAMGHEEGEGEEGVVGSRGRRRSRR